MLPTIDKILVQKVPDNSYNLYVVLPDFMVRQHTTLPYTVHFTVSDLDAVLPEQNITVTNTFILLDYLIEATNFNVAVVLTYEDNVAIEANQDFDFSSEEVVHTIIDIPVVNIEIDGHIVTYEDSTGDIVYVYVQRKDNSEFPFRSTRRIIGDLQTNREYLLHFIKYVHGTNIINFHLLYNFTFARYLEHGIRSGMVDILEDIGGKINIRGFENLDKSVIQSTFDSVKNEHKIQLIRSDIDRLHWKPNISNSYILDLDYYTVYDSDNKSVESFGEYDRNLRKFVSEDDRNGIYYVVGLWANIYDVLSELWNIRASNRVDSIGTRSGTIAIKFEQEFNHCIKMRDYYKGLIGRSLSW